MKVGKGQMGLVTSLRARRSDYSELAPRPGHCHAAVRKREHGNALIYSTRLSPSTTVGCSYPFVTQYIYTNPQPQLTNELKFTKRLHETRSPEQTAEFTQLTCSPEAEGKDSRGERSTY